MQPLAQHPEPHQHVKVQIRHHATGEVKNNGWFPETDVESVVHVEWQNEQFPRDRGEYWIAQGDGVIWFHDGRDRIAAANDWRVRRYLYRGIERRLGKLLKDYLGDGLIKVSDGDCVVNFGANIGEVSLALNRMGAHVFAIEPDPYVLPALAANARGRRIYIVPCVAWFEDGDIDLHIATEKGDTSAINASDETISVPARRIDTAVCAEPYLIVGDAEGAEPEVLRGATDTLKRTRYVSIRVGAERNGKCPGPECKTILGDAGFDILVDENEILIGKNRALV